MTTASIPQNKPRQKSKKSNTSNTGWQFSLKLVVFYLLSKLKPIHRFLPEGIRSQLPMGWSVKMLWVAFSSGGRRFFYDYYCKLKQPVSYAPKVQVPEQFKLTEKDIESFYWNGYMGPFDLVPEGEIDALRAHLVDDVLQKESEVFSFANGDYIFEEEHDGILTNWDEPMNETYKSFYINYFKKMNRHFDDSQLMDLFKHPAVTERAAQLLGSDLLLWRTTFFDIQPHSRGTELHQGSAWLYENQQEPI
ncbi:MAG: hypothetical protein F6J87_13255, partial [Spirulina sp. SIO3F2]|nr:hypothetical protein [Spirulina sp. SIO3F2]